MAEEDPYGLKAKFEALKNRKRYEELSAELLLSLEESVADVAVLDFVTVRVGPQFDLSRFRRLPRGLRMYYATQILDMELQNGGFHQFFWNSSRMLAAEAAFGFQLLGELELAALTDRASVLASRQSQPIWRNPVKALRAFSLSAQEGRFDDLDRRYYVLAKGLSARRRVYVQAHPEEFETAQT